MEVHHTAIEVSDLEATTEFYEDGLGLEHAWDFHTDDGVHNYYVTGDEPDTWIQFVHDPDADTVSEPSGIVHLAVLVDDADATFEHVVEATNCQVTGEPTTIEAADARVAFVKDPDGYEVEIFHRLD
jgi:lactoylglutathione lyase